MMFLFLWWSRKMKQKRKFSKTEYNKFEWNGQKVVDRIFVKWFNKMSFYFSYWMTLYFKIWAVIPLYIKRKQMYFHVTTSDYFLLVRPIFYLLQFHMIEGLKCDLTTSWTKYCIYKMFLLLNTRKRYKFKKANSAKGSKFILIDHPNHLFSYHLVACK